MNDPRKPWWSESIHFEVPQIEGFTLTMGCPRRHLATEVLNFALIFVSYGPELSAAAFLTLPDD